MQSRNSHLWLACFGFLALACLGSGTAFAGPEIKRVTVQGNPIEAELLKNEMKGDVQRFLSTGMEVDREINDFVQSEIQRRKSFINKGYERLITDVDLAQRDLRLEAIRYLESFLRKYPDHDDLTPDAMFRLAELYYEKSSVDFSIAMDLYDEHLERFERGELKNEPEQPLQNYKGTMRVYELLTSRYPSYRYADAAMYLLGYVQDAAGEFETARGTFRKLTNQYPKSTYLPESYLRIGEYHFDDFEWEQAIAAYKSALDFKDSRFYDKAIYKLAWTYFQQWDYDSAIATFKDLIRFYDGVKGSARDRQLAQQLRAEAIEYLARSLAEDDWDGDGEPDPDAGVERAVSYLSTGEPYERDILKEYARSLYELHDKEKYGEAARVFSLLIQRDPLDPENPSLQEKVIAIYDIMDAKDKAAEERKVLVQQFNPRTKWYAANRAKGKATAEADELVELAMRQQAQLHHQAAQGYRKRAAVEGNPELLRNALAEYQKASDGYNIYLASYPTSRYAYDIRYFMGETLFFSGEFEKAAQQYMLVRDAPGAGKYQEDAAFSAIKALERELELQVQKRKIPSGALPSSDQAVAQEEVDAQEAGLGATTVRKAKAIEMPALASLWIAQVDSYIEADLNRPDDSSMQGKLAYQAADLLHRFKRFDESRPRLEAVINRYSKTKIAGYAAAHIINSYKEENDWEAIERWAAIIQEKEIGLAEDQARLQAEIQVFKLGAQFQFAEQLLEEKRYLQAAKEFERIVDEDKRKSLKFADKALYNAALAYQEVQYYDSAARIYERIITETRFATSEFVEDALFRLAENHKKFFNFESAVQTYLALVARNPKNKQSPYSLFEAARLLENDGKSQEAATQYEKYSSVYPGREDAAALLFRAGQLLSDMGRVKEAARIYQQFVERFDVVPSVAPLVVRARLELALHEKKSGTSRDAAGLFQKVIGDFKAKGLENGSVEAGYAARAQFALVEYKYDEYKSIILKGSLNQMGRQIQRKEQLLQELEKSYLEVFPYKAFEWTFAAYYRVGNIYQDFAETLYNAPIPTGLSEDEQDIYQMELEDVGVRYEDTAVQRYQVTVEKASELKVKNKWTLLALEKLNQYKPAEYPLLKKERKPMTLQPLLTTGRPIAIGKSAVVRPAIIEEAVQGEDDPPPEETPTEADEEPSLDTGAAP